MQQIDKNSTHIFKLLIGFTVSFIIFAAIFTYLTWTLIPLKVEIDSDIIITIGFFLAFIVKVFIKIKSIYKKTK